MNYFVAVVERNQINGSNNRSDDDNKPAFTFDILNK